MKKLFAMVSAAACLFVACFGLAGCDSGNYSETFPGVLSEDTYETTDAAAAAFLENEIAAPDVRTTFVSYKKSKDITEEELAAFELDVAAEDIGAKEWGTVTYEATLTSGVSSLAAGSGNGTTKHVKVGMFEIDGVYRYFVPVAGTGEMISKSYYESVFDPAKYKNCTETFDMTVTSSASTQGQKVTLTLDTRCTMKLTEEAAELVMTTSGLASQGVPDVNVTVYVFKQGDGIAAYASINGVWQQYLDLGVSSWDELFEMNLDDFIDYSYFEKTKSGFKISPMKYEQYMQQYIDDLGLDYSFSSNMDYSGEATYFVTEGRLSKATTKVSLSMKVSSYGYTVTAKASASGVNVFSDFGTTTVQIPEGLQAYING